MFVSLVRLFSCRPFFFNACFKERTKKKRKEKNHLYQLQFEMKFKAVQDRWIEQLSSATFRERIIDEDDTMLENVPIIIQINAHGYLTYDSQSGKERRGTSVLNHKPYITNERSYMFGFMPTKQATSFIKNMGLFTDKNAVFIPVCGNDISIPHYLDLPLTTTRQGKIVKIDTHASMAIPKNVYDMEKRLIGLHSVDQEVVLVFCWDTVWNRPARTSAKDGLFQDILKILKLKTTD